MYRKLHTLSKQLHKFRDVSLEFLFMASMNKYFQNVIVTLFQSQNKEMRQQSVRQAV